MAGPKTQDGFTQIPNSLIEHVLKLKPILGMYDLLVLLAVYRLLFGFHKTTDKIALSRLSAMTGIPVSHVSPSLRRLNNRHLITRSGKYITVENLPLDVNLHADVTTENLHLDVNKVTPRCKEKLHLEGDSKETLKETLKEKEKKSVATQSFEEYSQELRPKFSDIDFAGELEKFRLYNSENGRELKSPKLALLRWMEKAQRWAKEHPAGNNGNGHYEPQGDPWAGVPVTKSGGV